MFLQRRPRSRGVTRLPIAGLLALVGCTEEPSHGWSSTTTIGSTDEDATSSTGAPPSATSSAPSASSSPTDAGDTEPDPTDGSGSGSPLPEPFSFGPALTSEVVTFDDLQLGDLDGDGCADLALAPTGWPPRITMFVGACDGTFPGPSVTREVTAFSGFVLGDVDGDARVDLVTYATGSPPRLMTHRVGDGLAFAPGVTTAVWAFDRAWAGDVDGDGLADVLTQHGLAEWPWIFAWAGAGDGSFEELGHPDDPQSFDFAAIGRVDGDARCDLVTGSVSLGTLISRWRGHPDGEPYLDGDGQWLGTMNRIALGDLDGDGRAELLGDVEGNDWRVLIHRNPGDAFDETPQVFDAVSHAALRSADLDADGRDDLVVAPTGWPPRVTAWLVE